MLWSMSATVRTLQRHFLAYRLQSLHGVVGKAKLGVDNDASCIFTHAYQPCLHYIGTNLLMS